MAHSPATLVVFARAPEKGLVKTRLGERFSQDQCLAIYEAMLMDVLELASSVPGFDRRCLYWAGAPCFGVCATCFGSFRGWGLLLDRRVAIDARALRRRSVGKLVSACQDARDPGE